MATSTQTASPAARFLGQPKRMLIDGEWVEARHRRTLEVYDPAIGDIIDHVPAGDAEDIDLAVVAARGALEDSDWSRMTASERGRVIWRGVADVAEHIKVGRGLDAGTEMGPLVSAEQLERVTGYLESARGEGVRTVVGGDQVAGHGYCVAPTVLDRAGPKSVCIGL